MLTEGGMSTLRQCGDGAVYKIRKTERMWRRFDANHAETRIGYYTVGVYISVRLLGRLGSLPSAFEQQSVTKQPWFGRKQLDLHILRRSESVLSDRGKQGRLEVGIRHVVDFGN
jgi:hypothetical protein